VQRGRLFAIDAGPQIGAIQEGGRRDVSIFEQLGMLISIPSIAYYQGKIACESMVRHYAETNTKA